MTRILVVSTDLVGSQMAGPGIRALELARALARAGNQATLAVPLEPIADPLVRIVGYRREAGALGDLLKEADLLVGQGFVFEAQPELLASDLPIAIDLYDPLILESLDLYARADHATATAAAGRYLAMTQAQLRRGDFFFCATETQRDYWLGALSLAGRLTPELVAQQDRELRGLIDLVPSGITAEPPKRGTPVLRGVHPAIGADSVVLVWAGGLWDWFDPQLVVRAVAALHDECPHLRLCFFAGARPNPDGPPIEPRNIATVRALAAELDVLDRAVILLDRWVPYNERGTYLAEADIGVSAHLPGVETRFAFRTRLLDYLWARLPLIGSSGDSLGMQIAAAGGGMLVSPGDETGWQAAIRQLYHDPARREACRSALEALAHQYHWDTVVQPLARFCAAPARIAPPAVDLAARLAELEAALAEREHYVRHVEQQYQALANRPPGLLARLLGQK